VDVRRRPQPGVTKLVENAKLSPTEQDRHTHLRHHPVAPFLERLFVVDKYFHFLSSVSQHIGMMIGREPWLRGRVKQKHGKA
jgi:hypothetical protein